MVTLWLFNIAMEHCLFIDGSPIDIEKMVIFHGYVTNSQMVILVVNDGQ